MTFESGQVWRLALSPDGSRLFAVDTPDDRLELFAVDATTGNLTQTATVPVGLEPVAVAARTNTEVWAVNHLSDSVFRLTIVWRRAGRTTARTQPVSDELVTDLHVRSHAGRRVERTGVGQRVHRPLKALSARTTLPSRQRRGE